MIDINLFVKAGPCTVRRKFALQILAAALRNALNKSNIRGFRAMPTHKMTQNF